MMTNLSSLMQDKKLREQCDLIRNMEDSIEKLDGNPIKDCKVKYLSKVETIQERTQVEVSGIAEVKKGGYTTIRYGAPFIYTPAIYITAHDDKQRAYITHSTPVGFVCHLLSEDDYGEGSIFWSAIGTVITANKEVLK